MQVSQVRSCAGLMKVGFLRERGRSCKLDSFLFLSGSMR
jgi:hypothetical protein